MKIYDFTMGLAHHRVSVDQLVEEHQIVKSEGLRFDSSRGLRIFSLFRTCDKSKIHFSPQYTPCIKIYIQTKRNKF